VRQKGGGASLRRHLILAWKSSTLWLSLCLLVVAFDPTCASAGIAFVGSTSSTTATLNVPADVQNGDLLLASYSYWSGASANAPAGWQLLKSASSHSATEAVWYRFANNDAPGSSYTWTFGSPMPDEAGAIVAYRGVDPSVEDGSCANSSNVNSVATLCSFATTSNNDQYIGFFSSNGNLKLAADLDARIQIQNYANAHYATAVADKTLGGAGSIKADSSLTSSGSWATIAVALKPATSYLTDPQTPTPVATATVTPTVTATVDPTSAPIATSSPSVNPTVTATAVPTATVSPVAKISYIGSTSTTGAQMTVPGGVQNGDLLLASYSFWSGASANAPTGWQLLQSASSHNANEVVWYRFANNDAPGSTYRWTFGSPTPDEAGAMVAYRGVDPSVEDGSCTNSSNLSSTATLCSFTTSFNNDEYIGFFSSNVTLQLPHNLNAMVLVQNYSNTHYATGVADKALGGAGTVPADSTSVSDGSWATIALALKAMNSTGSDPTGSATQTPTPTVTAVPTIAPTAISTLVPTPVPTLAPTIVPTVAPTAVATTTPTAAPTSEPAVSMLAPANNSNVAGMVSVAAQKNSSTVVWIDFYCDGNYLASSPPYSMQWDSTTVSDGPHILSVTAYGTGSVNLGAASTNITVSNQASPTATATANSTPVPGASPTPVGGELRPTNQIPNNQMPSASELTSFHSGVGACGGLDTCSYMQQVDGQFTGTTTAILEYEADKWCPNCTILNPLDGLTYSFSDLVKAIAVNETNWYQWKSANLSSPDPITGLLTLTPSHGDLENVSASQPDAGSWGIFQIAEGSGQGWPSSYPLSAKYTAFNADFKLAEQMGVEQGHLDYLSDASRSITAIANGYPPYVNYTDANGVLHPASTDINVLRWGAVGNWYSGGWYDSGAIQYIQQVEQFLHNQPWTQPGF
jgi:hypothetical protein